MNLNIVDVLREKENRGILSQKGRRETEHTAHSHLCGVHIKIYMEVNIYGYVHVFRVWSGT